VNLIRTAAGEEPPDLRVRADRLRALVDGLSFPRHHVAEARANERAAEIVRDALLAAGLRVTTDGPWRNVVGLPRPRGPLTLVGAHYDSVPGSPGADDNASACAAMLHAAEIVGPSLPVAWVGFNREEDGLLGSTDLVRHGLARLGVEVRVAHVLEMVGFTSEVQRVPPGLPIPAPPDGRFLGLLSKDAGNRELRRVAGLAPGAGVPIVGLQTWLGLDRVFPDLHRSDHSPFWEQGLPAVMWTDTANFRNPHYHQPSDTPDTLDYAFLARVTSLLVRVLETS
jgi:hypothetical protein